jgi:hypothetical protein
MRCCCRPQLQSMVLSICGFAEGPLHSAAAGAAAAKPAEPPNVAAAAPCSPGGFPRGQAAAARHRLCPGATQRHVRSSCSAILNVSPIPLSVCHLQPESGWALCVSSLSWPACWHVHEQYDSSQMRVHCICDACAVSDAAAVALHSPGCGSCCTTRTGSCRRPRRRSSGAMPLAPPQSWRCVSQSV